MAAMTQATFTQVSISQTTARASSRRSIVCSAAPKAVRPNPIKVAVAGVAAAAILAVQMPMPALAVENGVKNVVCASNPTSKICLKDSAKK